jgi:hypothetical protein
MGKIGKGVANTLCTTQKMYKEKVLENSQFSGYSGLVVCCVSEICFVASIHPSFLEAMAWKIVFRLFFHSEYIKDNLQTELSCWIKYVQSNLHEFFEYEK